MSSGDELQVVVVVSRDAVVDVKVEGCSGDGSGVMIVVRRVRGVGAGEQ